MVSGPQRTEAYSDCLHKPLRFVLKVIFALNQTLLQQESLRAGSLQVPYTTEDLIKHYNCGDLNSIVFNHDTSQVPNFKNVTLPASEQVTAQEIDSYFRQELIYKRNERMGRRVKALLEEQPDKSFFFAFGADKGPVNERKVLHAHLLADEWRRTSVIPAFCAAEAPHDCWICADGPAPHDALDFI
ncbi:Metalloprotease TIKI2 [Anabarilius grahami]|uniref:Metalloprotease TIKI n=1 Tax=Anabarilius grahami TaxID=495550 RepID=A0A3N0Z6D1_ANAGA|nr:Metalloprotease TIKI2 [Anabarilius grahami]